MAENHRLENSRSPKRPRWLRWVIFALVLIGLGAAGYVSTRKPPVKVRVVKVEKTTVRDEISSSTAGDVAPLLRATVRAELGARVVAVKHTRGDRVKKGDVVVLLDALDLDARVAQAQATIEAQRAAVAQAKARALASEQTAKRALNLADKGAGTTQLAEDSAAAASEAKEAANSATGLLRQSEAALRLAQVTRKKAELTAPFDGVLSEVVPDPGEELAPGAAVFEVIDDSKLHVDATLDEADAAKVKVGQQAVLKLDALPNHSIAGLVTHVAPAIRKDLKGARILPIEVDVVDVKKALDAGLRVGMSANVDVLVAEKKDVLSLPTNVIVGRGAKRNVYIVEKGAIHARDIEVGIANWERTEILTGVALGDQVISTLNMKELEEGRRVEVEVDRPSSK